MDIPIEVAAGSIGAIITGVFWFLKYKIVRIDRITDEEKNDIADLKERVGKIESVLVPIKEYDQFTKETTKEITDLHWRFKSLRETLNVLGINFTLNRNKQNVDSVIMSNGEGDDNER